MVGRTVGFSGGLKDFFTEGVILKEHFLLFWLKATSASPRVRVNVLMRGQVFGSQRNCFCVRCGPPETNS